MFPIKPTVGFEPTDPYEKARYNIWQAFYSFRDLTPAQRGKLAKEVLEQLILLQWHK